MEVCSLKLVCITLLPQSLFTSLAKEVTELKDLLQSTADRRHCPDLRLQTAVYMCLASHRCVTSDCCALETVA